MQSLSSGRFLVSIFKSWGGSEVNFRALGGHFGIQNVHFLSSWSHFGAFWDQVDKQKSVYPIGGKLLGAFGVDLGADVHSFCSPKRAPNRAQNPPKMLPKV